MKVAVTVWEDSVSTVCDFCSRVLIFDSDAAEAQKPLSLTFDTQAWPQRVNRLRELGVAVLLCGAVSRPLERLLATAGIEVIAGRCGSVEEVLTAYRDGRLSDARFALPGLGPHGGRRWKERHRRGCRLSRGGIAGNGNREGGARLD